MDTIKKQYDLDFAIKKITLLVAWLITYFSPSIELLMLVGGLVALDTYLGVRIAIKNGVFCSRRLESVVHKSVVYVAAILLSQIGESALEIPLLLKITAGYIAYTETVSVDENIEKLLGFSIFKTVLSKIKRKDG
jgi:hypothetical protein